MMKKRMLSVFVALALCLGLLPITALATAPNGQVLYVGGVQISSTGYWTTDDDGSVTAYSGGGTPTDKYIYYNADNNTLTLYNATIKNELQYSESILGGTYINGAAIGVFNQSGNAELTIKLAGTNTIAEVSMGIYVLASSESTGSSSLTITGNGSLDTSGSQTGISVQSNSNNAALRIENAEVTATVVDSYGGNGVLVQSGENSSVSLTVNGGSLTATGSNANYAGIKLQFGSATSGSGTPSVTVSGNAVVDAKNGGIANNSSSQVQFGTGSDGTGGIVWNGKEGTVYGKVELQENLEIGEGESLTIPEGASLDTNGNTITVESGGTLNGEPGGTIVSAPAITTESLPDGTVGQPYTATLEATGNNITWRSSDLPAWLTLDADTGTISGTPTTEGASTFTITATNSADSASKEYTLNIKAVSVTGVKLNKESLTLQETGSDTLTATVEPADATNKAVTWESSDTSIATVSADGTVTAISAGNATITATAADGSGVSASCELTVTHGNMVHTPKKDATCTVDGTEEYWTCDTCGKYFSDAQGKNEVSLADTVIPATGHGETERINAKDATCTQEGYTGDQVCKDCGAVLEQGHVTAKIAHNYKDGKCTVCGSADPNYNPNPQSPQTGDRHNVELWSSLLLVAAASFVLLTAARRREREDA